MVWRIVYGLLVSLCLGSGVWAQEVDTVVVRIVHSNDVLGQVRSVYRRKEKQGGVAQRVILIRSLAKDAQALVFDVGNTLGPDALSAWDGGQTMVAAMAAAGGWI